jgi:hypothetical protein
VLRCVRLFAACKLRSRMHILTAAHVIRAARSPSLRQAAPSAAATATAALTPTTTTTVLLRTFGSRACAAAPAFGTTAGLTRPGISSLLREIGARSSSQSKAAVELSSTRVFRGLAAASVALDTKGPGVSGFTGSKRRIVYPAAASASLLPVGARMASSQGTILFRSSPWTLFEWTLTLPGSRQWQGLCVDVVVLGLDR